MRSSPTADGAHPLRALVTRLQAGSPGRAEPAGAAARRRLPGPGHHLHRLRRRRGHRAHLPDGPPAPGHPGREWALIEAGLVQRVTALNRFLDDLYVGDRAVIQDGVVPNWLVTSQRRLRAGGARHPGAARARCLVAGIDLVRDGEGTYRGARGQPPQPAGISYVLENRAADGPGAARRLRRPPGPHRRPLRRRPCWSAAAPRGRRRPHDPNSRGAHPGVYNCASLRTRLARQMGVRGYGGPRPGRRRRTSSRCEPPRASSGST